MNKSELSKFKTWWNENRSKDVTIKDSDINCYIGTLPKKEGARKCVFRNSIYYDISNVRAKLMQNVNHVKKYKGVDLQHYIDELELWNDKKNKTTTDRGWFAYIRQFMNSDIEKGKLFMKKIPEKREADLTQKDLAIKRGTGHINY